MGAARTLAKEDLCHEYEKSGLPLRSTFVHWRAIDGAVGRVLQVPLVGMPSWRVASRAACGRPLQSGQGAEHAGVVEATARCEE